MGYNWKDDLTELDDAKWLDEEERLEVIAACPEDDPIMIWMIDVNSRLYDLLEKWYTYKEEVMEDEIRSCFEHGGCLCFVTGCGYSIMSADLLGGTADGQAEREFDEFVREEIERHGA